jgi:D-xylose transport system substrate-binding protein
MRRSPVLRVLAVFATAVSLSGLAACSERPDPTLIAFLLGSDNSPRWSGADEPAFRDRVDQVCPDCEYVTLNADGDPAMQRRQLDEVLEQGADVVVLNAVTSEEGEGLVTRTGDVPVVAYDRFVPGADYYVSYDASAVGTQIARAVVRRVGKGASVLLLNGAQTDANGVAMKTAVHEVFNEAGVRIVAEKDPETWSTEEARTWVAAQLQKHPAATLDAIVVANDTQAAGVAQVLTTARVPASTWPVVTGQDANLSALRRIVLGRQTLTVYKSFPREAEQAADIAVTLVTGGEVADAEPVEGVPGFVFRPQVVTIDNLANTVVRDGVVGTRELCAGALLGHCEELGLR